MEGIKIYRKIIYCHFYSIEVRTLQLVLDRSYQDFILCTNYSNHTLCLTPYSHTAQVMVSGNFLLNLPLMFEHSGVLDLVWEFLVVICYNSHCLNLPILFIRRRRQVWTNS